MKTLLVCSLLFAACAPTAPSTSTDYTNPNAQHAGNVSALYALTSANAGTGIEVEWLDSTGQAHKLSSYQGSKPVILAFGTTSDATSDQQFAALDSVRNEMGDSVRTIAIANDPSGFRTVVAYVAAQHLTSQFISDSTERVEIQFATTTAAGPTYYVIESIVLGLDGNIVSGGFTPGFASKASLEALVRKVYHP